jgi:hypothetical protein
MAQTTLRLNRALPRAGEFLPPHGSRMQQQRARSETMTRRKPLGREKNSS